MKDIIKKLHDEGKDLKIMLNEGSYKISAESDLVTSPVNILHWRTKAGRNICIKAEGIIAVREWDSDFDG